MLPLVPDMVGSPTCPGPPAVGVLQPEADVPPPAPPPPPPPPEPPRPPAPPEPAWPPCALLALIVVPVRVTAAPLAMRIAPPSPSRAGDPSAPLLPSPPSVPSCPAAPFGAPALPPLPPLPSVPAEPAVPVVPASPMTNPSVRVTLTRFRVPPSTSKILVVPPPLIVTEWPVPSRVTSCPELTAICEVSVMVPLQLNVTWPPVAMAADKAAGVQLETALDVLPAAATPVGTTNKSSAIAPTILDDASPAATNARWIPIVGPHRSPLRLRTPPKLPQGHYCYSPRRHHSRSRRRMPFASSSSLDALSMRVHAEAHTG